METERVERRLAAILSSDVVGYSQRMALDEEETVAAISAHRERVTTLCAEHRGRLVDFTGDNFLAEFAAASDAVSCALAIQAPSDGTLACRIGIHVGEIRAEAGRVYGSGVNIAARLEQLAESAGICISSVVLDQVRRQPGLGFLDLGPQQLKNIPEPVHVFRVESSEAPSPAVTRTGRDDASIAVLAFANMSPDKDQEFFADGMAQEIMRALTRVDGLRVTARTSAFSFKGTSADIATIGRRLEVASILEGSVRRAGARIRVSAELVDVETGRIRWSETFDRSLDDVFQIQDEIARTIVGEIRPKLLGDARAPLVVRGTESPEAYELYLRAGDRISRFEHWDTRTAIEMLSTATSIDPGYADAWARLALAYSQLAFAFEPDERWREPAERAVRRAFELDPENPDAHYAHARMLWSPQGGFQHRTALCALGECLRIQPGNHDARIWQGVVFLHVGLLDEARDRFAEALAAEPDDATRLNWVGQTAQFQGRFEEADEYLARAYRADPTLWLNHSFRAPIRLYLDDLAGAERVLETARQALPDDLLVASCEALLWAKRGEVAQADAAIARATGPGKSIAHAHHCHHYLAAALAELGRSAEAIESLRSSAALGFPNGPAFSSDPHLASLQDLAPMQALLARLERERQVYAAEFSRAADQAGAGPMA